MWFYFVSKHFKSFHFRRRKRRVRENPSEYVDGINGYGIHSTGTKQGNSSRSILKIVNANDFDRLEQSDLQHDKKSTSTIPEDCNTPLDFSSKKCSSEHNNIIPSFPYLRNHYNQINYLSVPHQKEVDEEGINRLAKRQNASQSISMEEMENRTEMEFLDMTRFENVTTSIQNTTNPFSIDRLISKQEYTMETKEEK